MNRTKYESSIMLVVNQQGKCSIADLATRLEVSEETVRRHIKPLVEKGLIYRVHGGIELPEMTFEAPFHNRLMALSKEKQQIALRLSQEINDGDSLILGNGTTTQYVANSLRSKKGSDISVKSSPASNLSLSFRSIKDSSPVV